VRARTFGALLAAAAFFLPAAAAAHETSQTGLTAAERHRAADLADVSVPELERRVRPRTNALGVQPGTREGAARLAATTDPGLTGSWSQVIPAPVVPVAEALLPTARS
jgi:hypothetical protein